MLVKSNGVVQSFDSREACIRALVKSARRGSIADIKMILDLDETGELAAAAAEQRRQFGVLLVPKPLETAEQWEELYGANAQNTAEPKR